MDLLKTVQEGADDRKEGMTLGEIHDLVQAAIEADFPDSSRVRVSIGWGSQIQQMTITQRPREPT